MHVSLPSGDLVGEPPELEGGSFHEVLCIEFWYQSKLVDAVNSLNLKIGDQWHMVYFDHGIVFWRMTDLTPKEFRAPEIEGEYRIVDLGVRLGIKNCRIKNAKINGDHSGATITIEFANGKTLEVRGLNDDSTSWAAA